MTLDPAAHFQVKKEGRNKGKWFYTCQESGENGCGFFLWDESAIGREMKAVMSNRRSEPGSSKSGGHDTGYKGLNTRWIQNLGALDENKFKEGPPAQEYEKTVTREQPETPRKAAKTNPYITPGTKRTWDEQSLLTPVTKHKDDFSAAPSYARQYGSKSNINEPFGLQNRAQSPTPIRIQDPNPSESHDDPTQSYDTTEEVLSLLQNQKIDEEMTSKLRTLLDKHALRVSGIVKGRDITRVALKAKDAKIAELQQKISALETEREMDKTIISHVKRDMAQSITSKPVRERG